MLEAGRRRDLWGVQPSASLEKRGQLSAYRACDRPGRRAASTAGGSSRGLSEARCRRTPDKHLTQGRNRLQPFLERQTDSATATATAVLSVASVGVVAQALRCSVRRVGHEASDLLLGSSSCCASPCGGMPCRAGFSPRW
ncbi:unnamed protein product [Prorocentrum cordatum]|uniref:Uncharacterized protein n=1 Tax=Prorocentrum cordatum TaxID=2364126 RepID=A0ABN9UC81_9DINO|nr:unnamed protein product [Polarella glacialis]